MHGVIYAPPIYVMYELQKSSKFSEVHDGQLGGMYTLMNQEKS